MPRDKSEAKKENPTKPKLSGVQFSLAAIPLLIGAPCIYSLIVCCVLQRNPFHRLPSGVPSSVILTELA